MIEFYRKFVFFQVILDYLTVVLSFIFGYFLWKFIRPDIRSDFIFYAKIAFVYGLIYIFIFWLTKLYESDLSIANVEFLRRFIRAWIISSALLFTTGFLSKELSFSRLTFIFACVVLFVTMIFQRTLTLKFWQIVHRKGIDVVKTLIVGVSDNSINIYNTLINSPWMGLVPIGVVDDVKDTFITKDNSVHQVLGKIKDLEDIVSQSKVEHVIIDCSNVSNEKAQSIMTLCSRLKVQIHIIPHFYNISIQKIKIENILGIPLVGVNTHKVQVFYLFLKRIVDILYSSLFLFIASPLIVVILMFIKFTSKGPVLFSQERVGLKGKIFKIYKFRSMYVDAPKYEICPSTLEDPRVTKIGKFIRKSSLDEIPQFFNVLKGDMSIVGPRPEMQFIVENYNDVQRKRLSVKPGITGLWQISHKRGSPIHENIDYDLYYIENQCFTLDLAIIIQTVLSVMRGIGAC